MAVAKVLIHSQGNSEGPLKEAIEFYRPQLVFLISNLGSEGAQVVLRHLEDKSEKNLGRGVKDIEHAEMIIIEDAFSEDTVIQMFDAVDQAKQKAEEFADGRHLKFYAGVAGGTKLMVIGVALAAINGDISTYYVTEERINRSGPLLIEMGFMNNLMETINWLRRHYKNPQNLRYLREVVRREKEGGTITAVGMAESLSPVTDKAIRNALRVLKNHGLAEYDTESSPQVYSSTTLGRYVLSMFGTTDEGEISGSE